MAEFDDKLNSLLSNPEAMDQIMKMAQSLIGDQRGEPGNRRQSPKRRRGIRLRRAAPGTALRQLRFSPAGHRGRPVQVFGQAVFVTTFPFFVKFFLLFRSRHCFALLMLVLYRFTRLKSSGFTFHARFIRVFAVISPIYTSAVRL